MVSGQVVVVDHVDVGVPAFPQIAALRQADDLCRLTGDTVNRLFQRVQAAPAGQLAEQNLRGGQDQVPVRTGEDGGSFLPPGSGLAEAV